MADRQAVHKSGPLKQQNKPHKNGKHRTKGQIAALSKGRMSFKTLSRNSKKELRKAERKNKVKQLRANKRHESYMAKRNIGVEGTPPHLVVVLCMCGAVDRETVHSLLCGACNTYGEDPVIQFSSLTTLYHPGLKQRFTLLFPSSSDLYALLDVAKVADTLLLAYDAEGVEGDREKLALQCCFSQGLPATCHVIQGLDKLSAKEKNGVKKGIQKRIEAGFPGERVHVLNSLQDASGVLRFVSNQKRRSVTCRDLHPHLVAETTNFIPSRENEEVGTLEVSGYVRGRPLSVNGLLHIPGLGDFQMTKITSPPDPHPVKSRRQHRTGAMDTAGVGGAEQEMAEEIKVVAVADPAKQESLVKEVELDPMEGEQTWPTEEELTEAARHLQQQSSPPLPAGGQPRSRRVPRGTSDYQATWIVDQSEEEEDEEEGSEGESECEGVPGVMSDGEESDEEEEEEEEGSVVGSEMDTESVTYGNTERYDAQFDLEAEEKQLELIRAERENAMFPDEVDTPQDTPARIRFQKYRGLKSFRTSPWDPRENLPRDYARIFQFENFSRTKKRVLSQEDDEAALPGWFVTVHVSSVGKSQAEGLDLVSRPLVVFGLLPHENKMSVVHFVLRRCGGQVSTPVRSKERLVFHCGVRRFSAAPVFSLHTVGDKHKYERFFPRESVCVATVFAPISYPPQPTLVFKPVHDTHQLLAVGSLYKVDPNRVVCKRIVLSGHPFKINKRSAVIRYMFFNREDMQWFKPIELRTKCGRRGHIKEPLGTHGHMKCVFDGQLKAQDTVLMNLYKRVYPKWTYTEAIATPLDWVSGQNQPSLEEGSEMD